MPLKKRKESEIQAAILKYLRLRGVAYKNSTTGIFDQKRGVFRKNASAGYPDITFFHRRNSTKGVYYRMMFFEVKRDNVCNLTDEQKIFKGICDVSDNVSYHVVYSVDDVIYLLEGGQP